MRTPENLPRHELIGLTVTAETGESRIEGTVVDETQNTLVIEADDEKQVVKQGSVFRFELGEETVEIDGNLLQGRPEERILKKLPRKWEYTR